MNKILSLLTVIAFSSFHSAMGSSLDESDIGPHKSPALSQSLNNPYAALEEWSKEYHFDIPPLCDWPGTLGLETDTSLLMPTQAQAPTPLPEDPSEKKEENLIEKITNIFVFNFNIDEIFNNAAQLF